MRSIPIQDVHLLIAQARVEADNPAFKVSERPIMALTTLLSFVRGVSAPLRLHWEKVTFQAMKRYMIDGRPGLVLGSSFLFSVVSNSYLLEGNCGQKSSHGLTYRERGAIFTRCSNRASVSLVLLCCLNVCPLGPLRTLF